MYVGFAVFWLIQLCMLYLGIHTVVWKKVTTKIFLNLYVSLIDAYIKMEERTYYLSFLQLVFFYSLDIF